MTTLNEAHAQLQAAMVNLVQAFQALDGIIKAQQPITTNVMGQALTSTQVPPQVASIASDAPELKFDVALWEKPNSISGTFTISQGTTLVATYRLLLFLSKPNDQAMALNGYILPKEGGANESLAEANVGGVFVFKTAGGLEMRLRLNATAANEAIETNVILTAPTRLTEQSPNLKATWSARMHFYSAAMRAQLNAAPPAPSSVADLLGTGGVMAQPGQPADSSLAAILGQTAPTPTAPQGGLLDLLQ